jgi:hypothetical protein
MLPKSISLAPRVHPQNILTSLQYTHALQFNSSFNPLLHNGVCVAPQFEHSALTPPGAEFAVVPLPAPFAVLLVPPRDAAALAAVAPGPVDRVLSGWVHTVSAERVTVALPLVRALPRRPEASPVLVAVAVVVGTGASFDCGCG